MGKFIKLANEVGALVDEKNQAYGNSFGEVGDFLRILYPEGIKPDQYTDALCVVRIFDKLKRIASNKGAFGESPYKDIVGYGLLGLEKDMRASQKLEAIKAYAALNLETAEEIECPPAITEEKVTYEEEPPSIITRRPGPPKPIATPEPKKIPVNCAICETHLADVQEELVTPERFFAHEKCYEERAATLNITESPKKINV